MTAFDFNGAGLSVRARNILAQQNIATLEELARFDEAQMMCWKNCGPTTARELAQLVARGPTATVSERDLDRLVALAAGLVAGPSLQALVDNEEDSPDGAERALRSIVLASVELLSALKAAQDGAK